MKEPYKLLFFSILLILGLMVLFLNIFYGSIQEKTIFNGEKLFLSMSNSGMVCLVKEGNSNCQKANPDVKEQAISLTFCNETGCEEEFVRYKLINGEIIILGNYSSYVNISNGGKTK